MWETGQSSHRPLPRGTFLIKELLSPQSRDRRHGNDAEGSIRNISGRSQHRTRLTCSTFQFNPRGRGVRILKVHPWRNNKPRAIRNHWYFCPDRNHAGLHETEKAWSNEHSIPYEFLKSLLLPGGYKLQFIRSINYQYEGLFVTNHVVTALGSISILYIRHSVINDKNTRMACRLINPRAFGDVLYIAERNLWSL